MNADRAYELLFRQNVERYFVIVTVLWAFIQVHNTWKIRFDYLILSVHFHELPTQLSNVYSSELPIKNTLVSFSWKVMKL